MLAVTILGLLLRKSLVAYGALPISVQVVAVLLMIWARITFGRRSFHAAANPTEGGLVTWGPYKLVRHPIYASILYFLWPGVLTHVSPANVLLAVVGTASVALRIYAEEKLLSEKYPEYEHYAARTKRIIPFLF